MNEPQRYVKIPVAVEAMQWTRDTTMHEMKDFTNNLVELSDVAEEFQVYDRLHDSWISFKYGDWIIKGIKGEFYPCAPDVFKETYRPEEKNPRKEGGAQVHIYPGPAQQPGLIADAIAEHERRRDRNW